MVKIKEEFDYKSLSRRLEIQLDKVIAEHERQQKVLQDEIERTASDAQKRIAEMEQNYAEALEVCEYIRCVIGTELRIANLICPM